MPVLLSPHALAVPTLVRRALAALAWGAGVLALAVACAVMQVRDARAQPLAVPGKPAPAQAKARALESLRAQAFPLEAQARYALPAAIDLAPADATGTDKRTRVGFARDLGREAVRRSGPVTPAWVALPAGGRAARLVVTAEDAGALRVGLTLRGLPARAEVRVTSAAEPQRVLGPVSGADVNLQMGAQGVFWTPLTAGDTQVVEVWIPDDTFAPSLRVREVSHLALAPGELLKSTGLGAAQPCEEDVVCAARNDPALDQASRAVAKMLYTENGASYLCTGTLVNDGNAATHVPYFFTAAHCIDSQAAAATVNTFWFFEATQCGGKAARDYRQLTGGATLLYADAASDAALLRLADPAPEGAWFSGWDAAPLATGTPVLTLHHPAGDLKKVSLGQALGPTASAGSSYHTAAWTSGSTEGGSSGSGLFTLANGEYVLRGALRGGSASCSTSGRLADPSNRDYYSRLDLVAPQLAAWFAAPVTPMRDYTGMWYVPEEPGWGLSLVQSVANRVFITWYAYDAAWKPTWYVAPEAAWTAVDALAAPLYRTSGPAVGEAYDAARFSIAPAGRLTLAFGADGTAILAVELDGRTIRKTLRRLPL